MPPQAAHWRSSPSPEGAKLSSHRSVVESALSRVAGVDHVTKVGDPFQGGTVSKDGRIGYAAITFDVPPQDLGPAAVSAVADAIAPADTDGLSAELGGDAAFINAKTESSGAEAVGLLAALVVLVVAFGTIVAALVPIALALVAVATGLGSIFLLASAMDVSTAAPTIGAMIGLGVGIDYSLFITARYRENRAAGQDNPRPCPTPWAPPDPPSQSPAARSSSRCSALVTDRGGHPRLHRARDLAGRALRRRHGPHPAAGAAHAARRPHRRRPCGGSEPARQAGRGQRLVALRPPRLAAGRGRT